MTGQRTAPAGGPDPAAAARARLAAARARLAAARARLAAAQRELVAALVAAAPAPPGFAADRVAATTEALLRKRAREIAATWPALALALGPGFADHAAGALHGQPPAGALTDGWPASWPPRAG